VRGVLLAVFFFGITPILISAQWLLDKLHLPGWRAINLNYYRVLRALVGVHVRVVGQPVRDRAVLFVSNHVSWVDIIVLGSLAPIAFIAKREVRSWPLVGITAKLQRTIFVDRKRRHQTAATVADIVHTLHGGTSVVLFAEGTSSDGNHVLPFRSALLGAVKHAAAHGGEAGDVLIQPMSICYTSLHGIPMGRQHRPLVAWYGDLDFMPHIKAFVDRAAVDAVVTYGAPVPADGATDRKTMTRQLEGTVRRITAATLSGRPLPARAAQ
jgi:1-acyl-sn-glycerol-3-phosphate acyltransferase